MLRFCRVELRCARFCDGRRAARIAGNVVNGEARDNYVEGVVGKRQPPHIAGFDRHAIGHALRARIGHRRIRRVARLIDRAP